MVAMQEDKRARQRDTGAPYWGLNVINRKYDMRNNYLHPGSCILSCPGCETATYGWAHFAQCWVGTSEAVISCRCESGFKDRSSELDSFAYHVICRGWMIG